MIRSVNGSTSLPRRRICTFSTPTASTAHCGRNLLSQSRSPNRAVVESALVFFRRMGRRRLYPEIEEMALLSMEVAVSRVVHGREVEVANCVIEHVRHYHSSCCTDDAKSLNLIEVLSRACIASKRPKDAVAIVELCDDAGELENLVRSLSLETEDGGEFLEHLHATHDLAIAIM